MRLAVHNVVQLTDADVRDRFVVRHEELDELLAHLREPAPPRHALVIGRRGMGKSLLLRRVAVTIADDPELAERWLPVVLPEEVYEVTSIGDLWMAALAQLAMSLSDDSLTAQRRALMAERDPGRLETLALERLVAAGRQGGRKVLLLAENLDMVLDEQIDSQGGWSLRQALQNEPDLLLMGSAVNTFASFEDADEALYGFFHHIELCPLDDAAVRILWQSVTGVDLADGRAAAIRILTGGNPRLVTVLGRFSDQPDLSNLRADLDLLIDEYTPFFKANIEALPPVERKVFVTLADIWNPATAAEIAERTRMTSSQVSSLLGRLVRRGAVEIVEDERGKKRYELSERLYNLYHLLRRPDGEGRVRALVDILAHLHGPTELGRDVFPAIVGLLASELDTRIASCLHRHLDDIGTWESLSNGDCAGLIASFGTLLQSQIETLGADHSDSLLTRQQIAYLVSRSGEEEKALDLYSAVLADQQRVLGPDHRDTLTSRAGIAYLIGKSGDLPTALSLYRELAVDRERVLGLDHRDTLISRHMVAYLVGETGDPVAGLEIASGVLTRAEPILKSDDEFLRVARWLRDDLTLRTLRASGQPLPRELREVESAVTRPEAAPPPPLRRPR